MMAVTPFALLLFVALGVVGVSACGGKLRGPVAAALAIGVAAFVLTRFRGGTPVLFPLLLVGGVMAAVASISGLASCCGGTKGKDRRGFGWLAAIGIAALVFMGVATKRAREAASRTEHGYSVQKTDADAAARHTEIVHRSVEHGTVSPPVVFGPDSSASASAPHPGHLVVTAPSPSESPLQVMWRRAKTSAEDGVKHAMEGVAVVEAAAAVLSETIEEADAGAVSQGDSVDEAEPVDEGEDAWEDGEADPDADAGSDEGLNEESSNDENEIDTSRVPEVAATNETPEASGARGGDINYEVREEIGAASVSFGGFSSASERPNWAAEPRSDGTMEYHPQGAVMYVSTPALPSPSQAQSALDEKIRGALREYADLKLGRGSGALVVEAAPRSFLFGELVEAPEDLYVEANIRRYGEEAAAVYTGFARLHFDEFALQQMDEFKRTGVVRARVTGVSILAGAVLAVLGIVYGLLRLDSAARGYYTAWLTPVGIVAVIFVSLLAFKAASTVTWRLP